MRSGWQEAELKSHDREKGGKGEKEVVQSRVVENKKKERKREVLEYQKRSKKSE